jgi:hypothetical protein
MISYKINELYQKYLVEKLKESDNKNLQISNY